MKTIYFKRNINAKKPSTITNKTTVCPFCDKSQLADIVDVQESMTLVKNKFNTLVDADMYVLIESDTCNANYHTYSIEKIESLLEFSINKWRQFKATNKYKSVAMFKNKGRLSGGSIAHPHMQIIGFEDVDCNAQISKRNLLGVDVEIENFASFNLSTYPLVSFIEYNINLDQELSSVSKTVKLLINYIEDTYKGEEASYNLFFYTLEDVNFLKIMPRYPTSPITLGFGISQIYDKQTLDVQKDELIQYFTENISKLTNNTID